MAKRLEGIDSSKSMNFGIPAQRKASKSDVILNRGLFVEVILQPHQLTKSLRVLFVVHCRHEIVNMRNAKQYMERLFVFEIIWLYVI